MRWDCSDFSKAFQAKRVFINEKNRLCDANGKEYRLNIGKGGIKTLVEEEERQRQTANTRMITLNEYGTLGNSESIMRTTLDFENGTRYEAIVDVNVDEKRKAGDEPGRRVRPRINDDRGQTPSMQPPTSLNGPELSNEPPVQPFRRSNPSHSAPAVPPTSNPSAPKFRLSSELSKTIGAADIAEKIMDTNVQLSVREVLAVSKDVAGYLHERTKLRRTPVDVSASSSSIDYDIPTLYDTKDSVVASVNLTSTHKPFYALPSGRARVRLNEDYDVNATFDSGSEVNLMPRRIFEKMNIPIDSDINWSINAYDAHPNTTASPVRAPGIVGVCHDVVVEIGGVAVKQHIFVVKHSNSDLILGQPYERDTYLISENLECGDLLITIRSSDRMREARFVASRKEHERNRQDVRSEGEVPHHHLKL